VELSTTRYCHQLCSNCLLCGAEHCSIGHQLRSNSLLCGAEHYSIGHQLCSNSILCGAHHCWIGHQLCSNSLFCGSGQHSIDSHCSLFVCRGGKRHSVLSAVIYHRVRLCHTFCFVYFFFLFVYHLNAYCLRDDDLEIFSMQSIPIHYVITSRRKN
jgi:hypothetical protein